jgi:hypothetical protein
MVARSSWLYAESGAVDGYFYRGEIEAGVAVREMHCYVLEGKNADGKIRRTLVVFFLTL